MDFEEFLWATGRPTLMDAIRKAFAEKHPMGPLHQTALDSFQQYLVVGGMPQVVAKYVTTHDFKAVERPAGALQEGYPQACEEVCVQGGTNLRLDRRAAVAA